MSTKRISVLELLLWFLSFILVLVMLSPFALGFKIQNDYAQLIQKYSDIAQVDLRVVQFDRGFYSSNVVLELKLPDLPVSLQFKEEVIHGPVYLGLINQGKSPFVTALIKGEIITPAEFSSHVHELFAGQRPLVYQEVIDFSGNLESTAYMPVINTTLETETGPISIQSSGMTMNTRFSQETGSLSGDLSLPVFSLNMGGLSMNMQGLSLSYSGKMGQNDLLVGDYVMAIGKFEVDSDGDQFAFNNARIRTETSDQGALLDSLMQMNVREIFASNEKIGPVTFNFSINGINAASIKQLQAMQKTIEAKIQQGIPEEQVNAMVLGESLGILPDLFKQAVIKVNPFKLESELGQLETLLTFSVEGLDATTPADPMFMLNALNIDLDLKIDEALLRKFIEWELISNQQRLEAARGSKPGKAEAGISMSQKIDENLRGLVDEGILVSTDGVYSCKIVMQQGQMQMNNHSVDPMQQIMSQMAPPAAH